MDTLDFDPGPSTFTMSSLYWHSYILKLDVNGNFVWASSFSGGISDIINDLKVDNADNIHVTGNYRGQVDFDPGPGTYSLTTQGDTGIFVSKLDPSGNMIWTQLMKGVGFVESNALSVDLSGEVYISGRFFFTIDFDPGASAYNLSSNGNCDVFICKLSSSGNFIWARSFGGTNADEIADITTDKFNSVYVCGDYLSSVIDFDPGPGTFTVSTGAMQESYILKLFSNGNFAWVKNTDAAFVATSFALASDKKNGIYSCGGFSGQVDFNPGSTPAILTPVGFYDMYISKIDTAGNFIWAKSIGGTQNDAPHDIAVDNYGNIFTTGFFEASTDFDFGSPSYSITSSGAWDGFIYKLNTCQMPSTPINTTPASSQTACVGNSTTLTATSTGTLNWYMNIGGIMTLLNTGPSYPVNLPVGTHTFYIQAVNCSLMTSPITMTVYVDPCTGIEEQKMLRGVSIYPNPTNGILKVSLTERFEKCKISLINSVGQLILSGETNFVSGEPSFELNLKDVSKGLYFLKLQIDDSHRLIKVVKD
jgi:hypothetical protein